VDCRKPRSWVILLFVDRRLLRLAAAGAFILGLALFVAGLIVDITGSWRIGTTLVPIGGILMLLARLTSWKYKLPGP
jgi:uncharacterized membrane protein YgdD (TMEM256/DUF423 family)